MLLVFAYFCAVRHRKRLDAVESSLSSSMDRTSRTEKREQLKRTSFWLPEFTPGAKKDRLAKVSPTTVQCACEEC